MHGRFWVPKNICAYFFFFLIALACWVGALLLYYFNSSIAALISEDSIPFFDLNQSGNIGQWFLSLVWLGVSLFSWMMVAFVFSQARLHRANASLPREVIGISLDDIARYNGLARALFWLFFGLLSLVMSADTICRFSSFLYPWLLGKISGSGAGKGDKTFLTISLVVAGGTAMVFLFAAIRGYLKSMRKNLRFCPKWGFRLTLLLFFLSLLFAVTVPDTGRDSAANNTAANDTAGKAYSPREGSVSAGDRNSLSGGQSSEKDSDYRTTSYHSANQRNNRFQLESVFGVNVSFEKRFHLSKPAEEYVHLRKPIEDYLFDRLPNLTLEQVQTFLRYGFYGLFLICLAGTLGLLARSERKEYDMLLARHAALRPQGLASFQSPEMLKDIWKLTK